MEIDRCPTCAAAVRPGAGWCTLCYADLRPPAPPPPAPPQPAAVPMAHAVSFAPQPVERPPSAADPLTAAYGDLLAFVGGPAAATPPTATPTTAEPSSPRLTDPQGGRGPAAAEDGTGWPCMACGALNAFDLMACHSCALPFGTGLGTPRPSYDRRSLMVRGIAAAAAMVLLVGLLSFLGTKMTTDPTPDFTDQPTQTIQPKSESG